MNEPPHLDGWNGKKAVGLITVNGKVRLIESREPVANADIYLNERKYTTTGSDGRYSITGL